MGARRSEQVLTKLRETPLDLWHRGRRVEDITTELGLANGVASLAELYDIQWADPDVMLFDSPTTEQKVGRSFSLPRTQSELMRTGRMMKRWADHTCGMMGRSPDFINRAMSGYAAGADFLAQHSPSFADHVRNYHAYIRENDLALTHTLVHPPAARTDALDGRVESSLTAQVVKETDAGIVIKGARVLATLPISDEILVLPPNLLKSTAQNRPPMFGFAIANSTPGLKFLCRESVDNDHSKYDHPLGARFEEMDAVVIFDDVLVPWDRVFLYREADAENQIRAAQGTMAQTLYQVACRFIAKTEFLLGLISLMIEANGVERFQHIQEKTMETWTYLETMKAFQRAAEADAAPNEFGFVHPAADPLEAATNLYRRFYPRMVEIVQQIGASGLMAMPTRADVYGPLAEEIRHYYQCARLEARERIPLFRLAWDTAVSAFGSRQVLYERFFLGDPVRKAEAVLAKPNRVECMEKVREFLRRSIRETEPIFFPHD